MDGPGVLSEDLGEPPSAEYGADGVCGKESVLVIRLPSLESRLAPGGCLGTWIREGSHYSPIREAPRCPSSACRQ